MIWPLRRKRRETPAGAAAVTAPAAERGAPARDAWRRAEPLRTTATAVPGSPTTVRPALLVTRGERPAVASAPGAASLPVLRPVGTVSGLASLRPVPRAGVPSPGGAEPPLREPSPLPAPFSQRRVRHAAPAGPNSAPGAPLTRADDRYVGAPRPAAPAEPAPPWMSGTVPGMTPQEVAALFPGFTGLHGQTPTGAAAPAAPAPASRTAAAPLTPPARPSLAESRRRAAGAPSGTPAEEFPAATPAAVPQPPAETDQVVPAPFAAPPAAASVTSAVEAAQPEHAVTPAPPSPFPAVVPQPDVPPASPPVGRDNAPAGPAAPYRLGLRPPLAPSAPAPAVAAPTWARPHAAALRPPVGPGAGSAHPRGEDAALPQAGGSGGPAPPTGPVAGSSVVPRDLAAAFARLYGVDVSAVPVHRGKAASDRAGQMSARAFTEGGVVFLPEAAGSLDSGRGRGLLAHELIHAVQQDRHGSTLPAEDTAAGLTMELEAVTAERYFRGDPGAPEPAPASCDHTDEANSGIPSVSWTPTTGMVASGVQRATADQITEEYFEVLNELRRELGKGGPLSAESELDPEQRFELELRLRRAGITSDDEAEEGGAEKRPLDWAEVFAQATASAGNDLLRPFYRRSPKEQRQARDAWRQAALDHGMEDTGGTRSFLDEDDEEEARPWPTEAKAGAAGTKGPAKAGGAAKAEAGGSAEAGAADITQALYADLVKMMEQNGLVPEGSSAKTAPAGAAAPADDASSAIPSPTAASSEGTAEGKGRAGAPAARPVKGAAPVPSADGKKSVPASSGSAAFAALYPALVAQLRKDGHLPTAGAASASPAKKGAAGRKTGTGVLPAGKDAAAAKEPKRPLDYAEVFGEGAALAAADVLRPFYSRSQREVATSRDGWRTQWETRHGTHGPARAHAFLDEEDDHREAVPTGSGPARKAPRPAGRAAAAVSDVPDLAAAPSALPAERPPAAAGPAVPLPDPVTPDRLGALAEVSDATSLRLLSQRLYPLLADALRRELLTGRQRQGFP